MLSAYACEPGQGSEAAVGWGWVVNLSRKHALHVITRRSNSENIFTELRKEQLNNIEFTFVDLPAWARWWKRGNTGVHFYYMIWQILAYWQARKVLRSKKIDLIHHVTFVSVRMPSFMGLLGKPFVFGPVAGGEYSRINVWWPLGMRARIRELARYISNCWVRWSPLMSLTYAKADKVLVTSEQTACLLPRWVQSKVDVMLAVAMEDKDSGLQHKQIDIEQRSTESAANIEILYAGNFIYLKGMEYGIQAFARLCGNTNNVLLTLIGQGVEQVRWEALVEKLGITDKVKWISKLDREQYLSTLSSYDIFLFPSLHDSGGMVVMEAMREGLPVICLDVGGPGDFVKEKTGIAVPPTSGEEVVEGLHQALLDLCRNPVLRKQMGENARQRVLTEYSWESKIEKVEHIYAQLMK